MGKYFGTDGFRGEVNVKLTAELAFKTGRYLGYRHSQDRKSAGASGRCRIVIGEDTRHSCGMLRDALAAGITASGADVYLMHVTTTPSVSFITKECGFDCGVMISASHNPYYDNGLKVINSDGSKLTDSEIEEAEEYLSGEAGELPYAVRDEIGTVTDYYEGRDLYIKHLRDIALKEGVSFKNKKIAVDCANGSAAGMAREIFGSLGADAVIMGDSPDGYNINDNVGSTHIEALCALVKETGADIGFAYDGDADRCLASDETGSAVNGDQLMYACGISLKNKGGLKDDTIVATVMSNLGFFRALDAEGIGYKKTDVGDRFVWECMSENGYSLGGEQSGHIIFSSDASTGDGILTSIKALAVLIRSGKKASELFGKCEMYPQTLKNVRVQDKDAVIRHEAVQAAVREAEAMLGDNGRVLLRKSGTEPVLRVMAEAPDRESCDRACDLIIDAMKKAGVAG